MRVGFIKHVHVLIILMHTRVVFICTYVCICDKLQRAIQTCTTANRCMPMLRLYMIKQCVLRHACGCTWFTHLVRHNPILHKEHVHVYWYRHVWCVYGVAAYTYVDMHVYIGRHTHVLYVSFPLDLIHVDISYMISMQDILTHTYKHHMSIKIIENKSECTQKPNSTCRIQLVLL